jgi:hypothetical protein
MSTIARNLEKISTHANAIVSLLAHRRDAPHGTTYSEP